MSHSYCGNGTKVYCGIALSLLSLGTTNFPNNSQTVSKLNRLIVILFHIPYFIRWLIQFFITFSVAFHSLIFVLAFIFHYSLINGGNWSVLSLNHIQTGVQSTLDRLHVHK